MTPLRDGLPDEAWIDGIPGSAISALDRGLHYGDGLFETMACLGGRVRFLEMHLERLAAGCARLSLPMPDPAGLRAELAAACPAGDAVLKLIVTRGAGGRGYAPPGAAAPSRVLLRYGWTPDPPQWAGEGVVVGWSSVRLAEQPLLAGLKHLNRLEQVLARARLHDDAQASAGTAAQELLMATDDGAVICGTMSNVFIVHEQQLFTPRVDRAGVAGVLRAVIRREADRIGLRCAEERLEHARIEAADELFLTNARVGVWPVRQLGRQTFAVGSITRELQRRVAGTCD